MQKINSNQNKKMIFFLRAAGGIDHLVPVIDYMSDNYADITIEVLITDIFQDFRDDFRILYMKNKGICVRHALDLFDLSKKTKEFILQYSAKIPLISSFLSRLIVKIAKVPAINTQEFANIFWNQYSGNTLAIVHDHKPGYYDLITNMAKKRKVATISTPHAADNFENYLTADKQLSPQSLLNKDTPITCDLVIVPSQFTHDFYLKRGWATKEQMRILGCPRFGADWNKKLKELIKPDETLPQSSDYKILFMLPKFDKNTAVQEVLRTVIFISKIPGVKLLAQPHIRNNKYLKEISDYVEICDPSISSRALIDWADLTLFTATSTVFDNIVQDKPVLHLRRTMTNKLVLESVIKTWSVDTRDELYFRIDELITGKTSRTYSREEREVCINQLVQPAGANICAIYAEAILAQIEKSQSTSKSL